MEMSINKVLQTDGVARLLGKFAPRDAVTAALCAAGVLLEFSFAVSASRGFSTSPLSVILDSTFARLGYLDFT